MQTTKWLKVDVMALLLILEIKINFSLGFDIIDYQTVPYLKPHKLTANPPPNQTVRFIAFSFDNQYCQI